MARPSMLVLALLGWLLAATEFVPMAHGQCVPADCDDGEPCTTDLCVLGSCRHLPGLVCDDGNPCTLDDCQLGTGVCSHQPVVCTDNNACTTEACNPATGLCEFTSTRTCNDNNACTTEACNPATGLCETTSVVTCTDADPCTSEVCNPSTGQCQIVATCGLHGDIVIKLTSADVKTTYKRKAGGTPPNEYVKVTMSDVLVAGVGGTTQKTKVAVKAVVTGPEKELASLIYPLARLKFGSDGATQMLNQGYDFTVVDTASPCQDVLPDAMCAELAQRTSKAIDASLAMGPVEERDAFREAAQVFGVPPDTCVFIP